MARPDTQLHLRALLIAIGLYGAAALVWFLGPLLTIGGSVPLASERARGAAIAAVLALFAAQLLWRTLRASRQNRQLLDGIVSGDAAKPLSPGANEVAVIGKRFADAVAVLRNRRVGGARKPWSFLTRRPYVYELPWYILIGAPGAGKTTTIVNSGLQFPLAAAQGPKAVAGAGGTRNCDWWFTSEAVLIDTAGRYTTQDSYREADRAAWNGFLDLLAQHRPRQPINGAILTLSVTDLLQPHAEKRQALAREMRGRIDELHQRLGIRFPIYVLVTKTDLLAGFAEFFADFDKDERAQVWGVTFPLDGDADAPARQARLGSELTALEKTLNEYLFDRLRDERDRERRAAIFAFPQQWRVLREALIEMVQATFDAPTLEAMPLLRGVYFTSATQEGSPVDRALGGLARAMGLAHRVLPAARPSGKSFFVTRLLREVIIGESGLAGTNRRWERRRAWMHAGAVTTSLVLTTAFIGWGWHVYADNRGWLADASRRTQALRTQVAGARAAAGDVAPLVPLLDSVQSLEHEVLDPAAGRLSIATLGLDQRRSLGAVTQDVYHHLLRESLLPRIAGRLEQRLAAGQPDQVETLYEALKAYLMLFGGKNFDAAALRAYLVADWDSGRVPDLPAGIRKALRVHLDRLLASGEVGAPAQVDAALVTRTRELVSGVPLAERVYSRLLQSGLGDAAGAVNLELAAGPAATKVLTRASGLPLGETVPALYGQAVRRQGLRTRVEQVLRQFDQEAPWVLQPARAATLDETARARLIEQVESRHAAEGQRVWEALLRDLRLAPAPSLAAVGEQAQLLSRSDSPLLALLVVVLREVGPDAAAEPFASLRGYALGQSAGYQPVHAALGRLATQLAAIDDAVARKAALPPLDALRELADAAARAPEPVRALLQQLLSQAAAQGFAVMREPLNRQLLGEVVPACTSTTEGRYPFVRGAAQEASRDEVARVFGPGGAIDGFYQRQLSALLEAGGARTVSGRGAESGKAPALSADAVQAFQRAQAIRSAFFQDGARGLGVRLDMRLLELDPGIGQFLLDVDGQTLRFGRDTRTAQRLQWPGAGGAGRVTLQAPAPGAPPGAGYSFDGPWSLLRLFERVRIEPGASANHATVVFDIEGRRARFELRSAGGALPIGLDLEQFQCPKRL